MVAVCHRNLLRSLWFIQLQDEMDVSHGLKLPKFAWKLPVFAVIYHLCEDQWQPGAGTLIKAIPAFILLATGGCQGKSSLIGVLCAYRLSLIWINHFAIKWFLALWSSTSRGAICVVPSIVLALIREGRSGEQRREIESLTRSLLDAFWMLSLYA
jgi:hypothetical protein